MRRPVYDELVVLARSASRTAEAHDLLHEALIAAFAAGRNDFADRRNRAWLYGTIRNLARMQARSAGRRRHREAQWQPSAEPVSPPAGDGMAELLEGLSPALRIVLALALAGLDRREIAHLLRLPDTALRQRIVALNRQLRARGRQMPGHEGGLDRDVAHGRVRDILLPLLRRHRGHLATHDPDGHLLLIRTSRIGA